MGRCPGSLQGVWRENRYGYGRLSAIASVISPPKGLTSPAKEHIIMNIRSRSLTTVAFAGALMLGGAVAAVPANAAPQNQTVVQDGLVNLNIGNVSILEDANINVVAAVAATLCDIQVGPVAILGEAVDNSSHKMTVCRTDAGKVRITQNRA